MSWEMRCKCDVCGAWKGEGNKWLLAWLAQPFVGCEFLGFSCWQEDAARRHEVMHLCGDACKQKMLSEHLTRLKSVEPIRAEESCEAMPAQEQTYAPIECEYCGPRCYMGAAHYARVEAGGRFIPAPDGGVR